MRGPWPKAPPREWPVVRTDIASDPMFLDEEAALAAAAFPIDEATLVDKAKTFLYYGQGVEAPDMLAESFVFMGPFVGGEGGLPRDNYLKTVGGFDIKEAFPDLNPPSITSARTRSTRAGSGSRRRPPARTPATASWATRRRASASRRRRKRAASSSTRRAGS